MVLRGSWLLLFLALCPFGTFAQVDLRAEQRALLLGDGAGVIERLDRASHSSVVRSNPVLHARVMELLGEAYHRLSDIDEALQWWKKAHDLRVAQYGKDSPEAGVSYAYQARYHSYMAAAQHPHEVMALEMAQKAMECLQHPSLHISGHEEVMVRREYAYAYKVIHCSNGDGQDPDLNTTRVLFNMALDLATATQDTVWMAQLHHDIGNSYTDRVISLRSDPLKLRSEVRQARHHYARSLTLLEKIGLSPSEASMMDHFTLGLLNRYAYGTDSLKGAIRELDLALLHLARTGGSVAASDPLQFVAAQPNRAQAVELLHYRGSYFHEWYMVSGEEAFLHEAIRTSDAALPYWEAMLREYRSDALYKVVGSYGHFLFRKRSLILAERYWLTNDPQDAWASLLASERHKNIMAQRERLRKGMTPTVFDTEPMGVNGPRAQPGSLIINYHLSDKFLAHVISEDGIDVIELPELPGELWRGYGHLNQFRVHAFKEGPSAFAKHAFPFYQGLLLPILKGRPARDLVIIPDSPIAHLPFEALPTSPMGDSWSDLAYLGDSHTIRYASNLEQALDGPVTLQREGAAVTTVSHDTLSALPFADRLAGRIHRWFTSPDMHTHAGTALLDTLRKAPGLLHIATHAHAPDQPDALPYLVLSDGPFNTDDLYGTRVGRQLVVLSTCSSGDGNVYLGSTVISMGNAFLDAGAGAVVHTLWPVDDRSTSEVLELMYEGLDEGLPLGKALQQAKSRFIQAHPDDGLSHPFHWAGIVHAGQEVVLAPARPSLTWAYLAGGLCCLLGIMFYRRSSKRSARSATIASLE